jgi:hypothetical protein
MSSTQNLGSKHHQKEMFFNDGRGRLFTKAFLQEGNFFAKNDTDAKSIVNTLAFDIMTVKNYKTKRSNWNNNDISPEFTDFIIRTALWHRAIDEPSQVTVDGLRREYTDSINGTMAIARPYDGETYAFPANIMDKQFANVDRQFTTVNPVMDDNSQLGGVYPVTLADSDPQLLWNNVYANWANLDTHTQNFYTQFLDVLKFDQTTRRWNRVEPIEYNTVQLTSQYRFNLIKTRINSRIPLFSRAIPLLSQGDFDDILLTDAAGQIQKIDEHEWKDHQDYLRILYLSVYNNTPNIMDSLHFQLPKHYSDVPKADRFNLFIDELVRTRLYAIKKFGQVDTSALASSAEDRDYISLIDVNVWNYDANTGVMYKKVDGKRIEYGAETQADKDALTSNFHCYSTLVNAKGEECEKYINDCLINNDSGSLKECLKFASASNKGFYDIAKKEINNMHPLIALRTLQKYGFRHITKYDDDARMNLKKVECVAHWLQKYMAKKFPDEADQRAISNNPLLLDYLELIVQYVNANPALLNKNYNGKTEESEGRSRPPVFAKKFGIRPRFEPYSSGSYDMSMFQKHSKNSMYATTALKSPFQLSAGTGLIRTAFGHSINPAGVGVGLIGVQAGGAYNATTYTAKTGNKYIMGAEAINGMINVLIKQLEDHGKTLASGDKEKITKKLENMKDVENELVKYMEYIGEYNSMLDVLGDYNSQTLSLSSLRELTAQHGKLQGKHVKEEGSMLAIMQAIQNLIAGKDSDLVSEDVYQPVGVNRV